MARVGDRLLEAGKITPWQLRAALAYQAKWRVRLGEACIALGVASATEVLPTVAEHLHVPYIFIGTRSVPERLIALVPKPLMVKHRVVPVRVTHDASGRATLYVATTDPGNLDVLNELGFATRKGIRAVLASRADIEQTLRRHGLLPGGPNEAIEVPEADAADFVVLRGYELH